MSSKDIHDASPTSLSHIVGQTGVVNQLRVAIDAAFEDSRKLDDCLLVGPPGLGKSQIASILGQELAVKCHETLGQCIKSAADLNAVLLSAKDKEIVFVDECHELQKVFQTALYLAIDKRKVSVIGGKSVQSIPLAQFTLVLGTTDEHCLLSPLRDRMKLVLRMQFYSTEELMKIVLHRAKALQWATEETVPQQIANRSRGVPRLALRLLQSCRRVCRSLGEETITLNHLERACQLEGLDDLGLGVTERGYLSILMQGPSRLNVVASMLGLVPRTVAEVVEPPLLRLELIGKDDQGRRQLTALGREHVLKSCHNSVTSA